MAVRKRIKPGKPNHAPPLHRPRGNPLAITFVGSRSQIIDGVVYTASVYKVDAEFTGTWECLKCKTNRTSSEFRLRWVFLLCPSCYLDFRCPGLVLPRGMTLGSATQYRGPSIRCGTDNSGYSRKFVRNRQHCRVPDRGHHLCESKSGSEESLVTWG